MKQNKKIFLLAFLFFFSWVPVFADHSLEHGDLITVAQNNEEDSESVQVDVPAIDEKKEAGKDSGSGGQEKESGSKDSEPEKSYQFKGKFTSWLGLGLNGSNSVYFNYNRLQLELTEVYQNITFYVKGNGRYNSLYNNDADAYRRGENFRFDLTEAYVNYEAVPGTFLKQVNFIVGQQIVNWGKADEVRPTDIISPQDLTLLVLEDRIDRKLGMFGIKTVLNFGEAFRLEATWLPVQRATEGTRDKNSLFTPYSLLAWQNKGSAYQVADLSMPEKKLSHSDIALKAYFQILTVDFSFSFYNGYDPMPYYGVEVETVSKYLTPVLSRQTMWGFDFEKAIWGVGIRGEAAYFSKGQLFNISPSESPALFAKYGSDGLAQKDYLDATIGFDVSNFLIDNLYINLQYGVNHVFDYEQGLETRYGTEMDETNHSGIWTISYEFGNLRYKLEFAGNYNFSHRDYLLKPSFHIKIGPETKIVMGAYIFGGKRETLLGQFNDKDFCYLKLEHLF